MFETVYIKVHAVYHAITLFDTRIIIIIILYSLKTLKIIKSTLQ